MAKLVSVQEMIVIEKAAAAAGHSYARMLEQAGQSLAEAMLAYSQEGAKRVLALVGLGNNGGDALVALAELAQRGWKATAFLAGDRDDVYAQRLREEGGKIYNSAIDTDFAKLAKLICKQDVLLDGLLGTGIQLPLRQPAAQLLAAVGDALALCEDPPLVVAVDCPSGLNVENGEFAPQTLAADVTVCMAAVKAGMLTLPAFALLGELVLGDIGLADDLAEWSAIRRQVVDEDMVYAALPARPLDAHKGTFGAALIVAGARNYSGAPLLAAEAAYRVGAGLVTVATPEPVRLVIAGQLPEATWLPLQDEDGWIAADAAMILSPAAGKANAMLLGPGFGLQDCTATFIERLLKENLPHLVVDADGLKLLGQIKEWPSKLPQNSVLTPHPGEMASLTGLEIGDIQSKRMETAERFAAEWQQIVVLKGAFTVVASPDGHSAVIPAATPALATAGTGDVLAGMITGLRAQGMAAFEAAYAGAWLHAQAGMQAAERLGGVAGVLAGDLIVELPGLLP